MHNYHDNIIIMIKIAIIISPSKFQYRPTLAHTTKYSIATWHTYYNVYPLDLLIIRYEETSKICCQYNVLFAL